LYIRYVALGLRSYRIDAACLISNISWGTVISQSLTQTNVTPYPIKTNQILTYSVNAP
jgi:hypothetical protein